MSKYYVMVTDHRMAVASADTLKEIKQCYHKLSEYKGYRGKMKILQEVDFDANEESRPYPFLDLDNIIDEEEIP